MKKIFIAFSLLFSLASHSTDYFIVGKDTTIILDGSKSADSDGRIVSSIWSQLSGPVVHILNATDLVASVKIAVGQYVFRLTGTDDKGATGFVNKKITITQKQPVPPVVLPIKFSGISYTQSGTQNTITWKTADESDSFTMEVQRSTDGQNFSTIPGSVITANGKPSTYSCIDNNSAKVTKLYYRVKGIDRSQVATYTTAITVTYVAPPPVKPAKKCFKIFGITLWCW